MRNTVIHSFVILSFTIIKVVDKMDTGKLLTQLKYFMNLAFVQPGFGSLTGMRVKWNFKSHTMCLELSQKLPSPSHLIQRSNPEPHGRLQNCSQSLTAFPCERLTPSYPMHKTLEYVTSSGPSEGQWGWCTNHPTDPSKAMPWFLHLFLLCQETNTCQKGQFLPPVDSNQGAELYLIRKRSAMQARNGPLLLWAMQIWQCLLSQCNLTDCR